MLNSDLIRHEGNDDLFFAIEISVISQLAGFPLHFHAEGVRGTGKTTILRAARPQLPHIEEVEGCLYHCRLDRPHCPHHREGIETNSVSRQQRTMPFLEMSHAAKLGTVVGSIDLARLTDPTCPEAALLPGTVPQANRGILLVDEINRLAETAPDLADVLLSAMGTKPGRIQIEESGLPVVELPVEVSVWAASNPDEEPGPLEDVRRQLADRFDMVVPVRRPQDVQSVRKILAKTSRLVADGERVLGNERPPWYLADSLGDVTLPEPMEELIARIYIDYRLESLRAAEAMAHTARLAALVRGASEVHPEDLERVAPLVLRHRVDAAVLKQILRELTNREAAGSAHLPRTKKPGKADEGASTTGQKRQTESTTETVGEGDTQHRSWQKIVSRLRGLLAPPEHAEQGSSGQSGDNGGVHMIPGRHQHSHRTADHGTPQAAPTETPILSPPQVGRPLVSLLATELVRKGDMMES